MIAKNKYVWIKASGEAQMTEDPVTLWLSDEFDKDADHIYTLGNEVEVNFSVDVKKKITHR
jgi:hypothetical protein